LLAVASDRDRAEAHVLVGDLLRAEGQVGAAMEHYRDALRSQPDLARAHLSLGVALINSGKTDQGLLHIRRAVQSSDDSARKEAVNVLKQLGLPR
jgi:Tfp pilus assembly protein PilF